MLVDETHYVHIHTVIYINMNTIHALYGVYVYCCVFVCAMSTMIESGVRDRRELVLVSCDGCDRIAVVSIASGYYMSVMCR